MDYCSEGEQSYWSIQQLNCNVQPSMTYVSAGDLANALKKRNGAVLPEAVLLDWFVQLCLGLKHVHDRKILHRYRTISLFLFQQHAIQHSQAKQKSPTVLWQ